MLPLCNFVITLVWIVCTSLDNWFSAYALVAESLSWHFGSFVNLSELMAMLCNY